MLKDQVLLSCLARYWGLRNVRVTAHDGGMGSRTWFVDAEARRFHWVDPDAGYLALRAWQRPAISAALDELAAARPDMMTLGLLHADPALEAFLLEPSTGRCGVIDWSYALHGPLPYDLASAVMYVGGLGRADTLVSAYLDAGILRADEAERGLAPMLKFRWAAVQANYFSWRIAENNLTGISGPQDNEQGLEDARLALSAVSFDGF